MKGTLHVICTVYDRVIPLRILIASIQVQTDPRWRLYIVHDGPASEDWRVEMTKYAADPRITYIETPTINGNFGHPNRAIMLKKLPINRSDYVLITNDDNYYVPLFIELMGNRCKPRTGMVYCDTLHSYLKYDVLKSAIKVNYIDMGSFIVRLDVAKKTGFRHSHLSADGTYAVECAAFCRKLSLEVAYVGKALFVHN